MTWKRPDAFSQSANVLKNVFGSLRLDFVPLKTLRLYAEAAATAYEITHDRYSTDLFLNAGARLDVTKTLAVTLMAVNLLDRVSYEVSSYQGANYRYLHVPLRGF